MPAPLTLSPDQRRKTAGPRAMTGSPTLRAAFLLLCATLAACAQPRAEVSMARPLPDLPAAPVPDVPGPDGAGAMPLTRPNAEMAADLLDLVFRMESGRSLPVLTRFEGPVTVALTGAVPATAAPDLGRLIARLRAEAGVDISMATPGQPASVTIDFHPRATLQRAVPAAACFVVPRVSSLAEYRARRGTRDLDWGTLQRRERVAVMVPSDTSPQEVRDCLHEELAQAIGPLNDLYRLPDSVFNDDNFHSVLTGFDMLVLRVIHAPELASGMTEAEVARRLPALLARLNPGGEGARGTPRTLSPRPWIAAVEATFGPRGTHASRAAAAGRMLAIATAQGWQNDTRLAFSHFAVARTRSGDDAQTAIAAYAAAARIYHTNPATAIHAAHVDMQMAAFALGAGQPEAALAITTRATPVVRRAGNAALLATLLLMQAKALDSLGRADAAQAARLDSLAPARYGFGSVAQVRARMADIAALAGPGTEG